MPDWPAVRYAPTLYLMVWGASIRLWINVGAPPPFAVLGSWVESVWLTLGIICPPTALTAWWWLRKGGRWRVRGLWLRLGADVGMFCAILAYHLATVLANPVNESRIYARYIVGATLLFLVAELVRDVRAITAVERMARGR